MLNLAQFKELASLLVTVENATKKAAYTGQVMPWEAIRAFMLCLNIPPEGGPILQKLINQSPKVQFSEDGTCVVLRARVLEVA